MNDLNILLINNIGHWIIGWLLKNAIFKIYLQSY